MKPISRLKEKRKVDFVPVRVVEVQVPSVAEPDVICAALDSRALGRRWVLFLAAACMVGVRA
jgi:hypothetical protein